MFFAVAIVVTIGASVPAHQAQAGWFSLDIFDSMAKWLAKLATGDNVLVRFLYAVIGAVLSLALDAVSLLVYFGAWLVDVMLHPAIYVGDPGFIDPDTGNLSPVLGVLNSQTVDTGWRTVRDMCNTFFIFFLLLIAFAAILRVQKFGSTKTLLVKFIMAIFLINFSAVIAKIIIDIGQVFMYEIIAWMPGGFEGKAGSLTSIVDRFKSEVNWGWQYSFEDLVKAALAVVYSVMLGLTYIMLAGFLLVRLVMLVILIILSPFAFLSLILPSMSKYTNEWFNSIVKYSIFGPVFLFFIYLSATMANELVVSGVPHRGTDKIGAISEIVILIIPNVVALGMLLAVIPITQRLGVAGSKQLIGGTMGLGKIAIGTYGGIKLAGGFGKKGAAWSGRRVGVDSRKVKSFGYDSLRKGADKLSKSKVGVVSRTGDRIKGKIVVENAKQAAKDREAINKEQAKLTSLSKEDLGTLVMGNISKGKGLVTREATEETKIKTAAAIQEFGKKGGNVEELIRRNPGTAAKLASININTDELAKYDPEAAAEIESIKDSSKSKEEHRKEFYEKGAEDGNLKTYGAHIKENYYGDLLEYFEDDDLQKDAKSTKKKREEHKTGIDNELKKRNTAIEKVKSVEVTGAAVGKRDEIVSKMEDDLKKVERLGAKISGSIGVAAAERNKKGEIERDEKGEIKINTSKMENILKEVGGKNFKNLDKKSKQLYVEKIDVTGGISGIDFRGMKADDINVIVNAIMRRDKKSAMYQEALNNNILGPIIKQKGGGRAGKRTRTEDESSESKES